MRLANKIAIVTGVGAGIGEAIALRFAEEGARLVLNDISEPAGQATLQKVRDLGAQAVLVVSDISQEAGREDMHTCGYNTERAVCWTHRERVELRAQRLCPDPTTASKADDDRSKYVALQPDTFGNDSDSDRCHLVRWEDGDTGNWDGNLQGRNQRDRQCRDSGQRNREHYHV